MMISEVFSYIGFLLSLFAAFYALSKSLNLSLSTKKYNNTFNIINGRVVAYVISLSLFFSLFVGGYFLFKGMVLLINDIVVSLLIAFLVQIAFAFSLFSFSTFRGHLLHYIINVVLVLSVILLSIMLSYIYIYTKLDTKKYEESEVAQLYQSVLSSKSKIKKNLEQLIIRKEELSTKLKAEETGVGGTGIPGEGPVYGTIKEQYTLINNEIANLQKTYEQFSSEIVKIEYFIENNNSYVNIIQSVNKINSKIFESQSEYAIKLDGKEPYTPLLSILKSLSELENKEYNHAFFVSLLLSILISIVPFLFSILLSINNSRSLVVDTKEHNKLGRLG
jgi:hypothetical protein